MSEENSSNRAPESEKAIFTPAMREYLKGNKPNIAPGYENSLRGKIRQRVIGSFEDLQLYDQLEQRDRDLIFDSNKNPKREGNTFYSQLRDEPMNWPSKDLFLKEGPIGMSFAFISFYEFYHKTMRENGYPLVDLCNDLRRALEQAEQQVDLDSIPESRGDGHYEVSASVETDVRRVDTEDVLEDAKDRFQEDGIHGVTSEELKALAEADYITLHGNWE